jgi:hypothetical protein
VKEELGHGVVGNEEIDPSILVIIRDSYTERLGGDVEAEFVCNLGKMAVSIIVIDKHSDRLEGIRMTVPPIAFAMLAAPDISPIPSNIAIHDEFQKSVIVEVDPCG